MPAETEMGALETTRLLFTLRIEPPPETRALLADSCTDEEKLGVAMGIAYFFGASTPDAAETVPMLLPDADALEPRLEPQLPPQLPPPAAVVISAEAQLRIDEAAACAVRAQNVVDRLVLLKEQLARVLAKKAAKQAAAAAQEGLAGITPLEGNTIAAHALVGADSVQAELPARKRARDSLGWEDMPIAVRAVLAGAVVPSFSGESDDSY